MTCLGHELQKEAEQLDDAATRAVRDGRDVTAVRLDAEAQGILAAVEMVSASPSTVNSRWAEYDKGWR
jgi:hypothetical protein